MVQVEPINDGTFTIRLNGRAIVTGLTRAQADRLATSFQARSERQAKAPIPREVVAPNPQGWTWRDLFGFRRSVPD